MREFRREEERREGKTATTTVMMEEQRERAGELADELLMRRSPKMSCDVGAFELSKIERSRGLRHNRAWDFAWQNKAIFLGNPETWQVA